MSASQWRVHRDRMANFQPEEQLVVSCVALAVRDALQTKNASLRKEAAQFLQVCVPDVWAEIRKDFDAKMEEDAAQLGTEQPEQSKVIIAPPAYIAPRRRITKHVDETTNAPDVSSSWPIQQPENQDK